LKPRKGLQILFLFSSLLLGQRETSFSQLNFRKSKT